MLQYRDDALFLHPLDLSHGSIRSQERILGEVLMRTAAEGGSVDIDAGRIHGINAVQPRILCQEVTDTFNELHVKGGSPNAFVGEGHCGDGRRHSRRAITGLGFL